MRNFFYKYWILYYTIFFLLIGLLIYALLWSPDLSRYTQTINDLNNQLEDCNRSQPIDSATAVIDTTSIKVDNTINCDATVQSGGPGETTTQHELGKSSGTVVIEYDMKTLPDEINVYYDNVLVASSNGLVSNSNTLQFKYSAVAGKPTYCIVKISAPYDNTEWNYLLNCPQ
jgi:hypothetical protein